jgi:hypothetical protein
MGPSDLWQRGSGGGPTIIRAEFETEPLIVDTQIAIAGASDRVGSHHLHFVRDHPNVRLVTAVVCEAIVTETVVEPTEEHNVVLEVDVRPPPTTTTAAAAESFAATTKSSTTGTAETTTATNGCGSMSPACEPGSSAAARRRSKVAGSGCSAVRRATTGPLRRSSGLNGLGLFHTSRVVPERPPGFTPGAFLAVRISSSRVLVNCVVSVSNASSSRPYSSSSSDSTRRSIDSRIPRAATMVTNAILFFWSSLSVL